MGNFDCQLWIQKDKLPIRSDVDLEKTKGSISLILGKINLSIRYI